MADAHPARSACADPRCGHLLKDHGAGIYRDGCWERGCPCDQCPFHYLARSDLEKTR